MPSPWAAAGCHRRPPTTRASPTSASAQRPMGCHRVRYRIAILLAAIAHAGWSQERTQSIEIAPVRRTKRRPSSAPRLGRAVSLRRSGLLPLLLSLHGPGSGDTRDGAPLVAQTDEPALDGGAS